MKHFIILALIFIFIFGFFIWRGFYYPVDPNSEETVYFLVKKGQGAGEIAENLEKSGIIRQNYFFRIYLSLSDKGKNLKAGEYELSPSMTIFEIADKIISGDMIRKKITIIEGWNLREIGDYFEEKGIASRERILEFADWDGFLFPDTYEIYPQDNLENIIKKMTDNFNQKVSGEIKAEIVSQGKTLSEIVIMASLLEKEVRGPEDKKIVSGILWKRMGSGMLLQVDSFPDTYKYKGLPEAPICNPGLESIEAAVYSAESEYWFYLSASDGRTIFSRTLKEHNKAISQYLK